MFTDDGVTKCKLCPLSFGVALGITNGLFMIAMGLWAMWGHGVPIVDLVASLYPGFGATVSGALIGGVWGFLDGFIFGVIAALIYDCCIRCCCRKCPRDKVV